MTDMANYYDIEVKYYDEKKPVVVRCLDKEQMIAIMGYCLDERKRCIDQYHLLKCMTMHVVEWVKVD